MSDTYDQKRGMAKKMMGGYSKKPVSSSDKKMSERHLKNRAKLDKMAKKLGDKNPSVLKKSIEYNEEHLAEHIKAKSKAEKKLEKVIKKQE